MALVDIKSNLNQFKGKFTPDEPYEKSGRKINELLSKRSDFPNGFAMICSQVSHTSKAPL